MKYTIKSNIALIAALTSTSLMSYNTAKATPTKSAEPAAKNITVDKKVLRHVVMFQFKKGTTPESIKKIETEFSKLPSKVNTIIDYEWGTNISKENKAQGFTHCFIVTFKDQAGLDVYTPHPAHKAFVKVLIPSLEKVLVLDFYTQ